MSTALGGAVAKPTIDGEPAIIFAENNQFGLALYRSEGAKGKQVFGFASRISAVADPVRVPRFIRSTRSFGRFETQITNQSVDGHPMYMEIDGFGTRVGPGLPVLRSNGRVVGFTTANQDNRIASVEYPPSTGVLVVRSEFAMLFMLENGVFPLIGKGGQNIASNDRNLNESIVRIQCN